MIQNRDGSFENITDLNEALEKLQSRLEDPPKALHIGTKRELEAVKTEADLQTQLAELKVEVEKMKSPNSSSLHIPTGTEIDAIAGRDPLTRRLARDILHMKENS